MANRLIPGRRTVVRMAVTFLAMNVVHWAEDALQFVLGWHQEIAIGVVCAVSFPFVCTMIAEITHSKRFH